MPLTCQESRSSQGEEAERTSTDLKFKTYPERKNTSEALESEIEPILSNEELESSPLDEYSQYVREQEI
jgi:hypothetical protein